MAGDWSVKTIAECASPEAYSTQIGPFGKALMADQYTESGVPILRGVNVNRGRFHDDDFVFIDDETADRLSKFESYPGDVLLVHKGTLGQIGLMPRRRKYHRYIMGNSMMRVRCDPAKLLPEYLYYWLSSAEGQHYLFSRVSQVGVPQIQTPLATLRQATLPVPPLSEQRAIAHILGTLDDKIELNRRMNETLEAMARALFKSWFVDFDPVRAKAEGSDPGLPKPFADLFSDRFKDSELGEIPVGWGVDSILTQATLLSGGTPKTDRKEYWGGNIAWASAKDVSQCGQVFLVTTERTITVQGLEESATQLVPALAVVVVARGATTGRMVLFGREMAMNQTCYGLASRVGAPFALYCQLCHRMDELVHAAHGSVFDTITTRTFEKSRFILPPEPVLRLFEATVAPFFRRILLGTEESRTLAALRDTLLPKLISGELRVGGADRIVGQAV